MKIYKREYYSLSMAKRIRKSSIIILIISLVALGASVYISFFSDGKTTSLENANLIIFDEIMETGTYNLTFTENGESHSVTLVPLEYSYEMVLGEILELLRNEGGFSISVPISDTESQDISLIPETLAYDVVIPEIINFVDREGSVTLIYHPSENEIREVTLVKSE